MLQNTLGTVKVFQDLKNTESVEIAMGRSGVPYPEYVTLVQKVAANYDKRTAQPLQRKINCHVQHNGIEDNSSHDDNDDEVIEFDSDGSDQLFGSVLINATQTNCKKIDQRARLPHRVWNKIPCHDQIIWDQISNKSKKDIMFTFRNGDSGLQSSVTGNSVH